MSDSDLSKPALPMLTWSQRGPTSAECFCAVLLSVQMTLCAADVTASESIDLHAFSDVVHRGINLTDGRPALGLNASYDFASGVFVGVGGHYASGEASGRELLRSLNTHLGWFTSFRQDQALEISLSHYAFDDVADWSYSELRGDWHLSKQLSLTAAWSPDYHGRAQGSNFAVTWKPDINDRTYMIVSGGPGWLGDDIDKTLLWGTVGIGTRVANFDVELSFSAVNENTRRVLLTKQNSLALRISYRLR